MKNSNFRDISLYNPNMKSDCIFRSSTLSLIEEIVELENFLKEKNIGVIVDLRADKEIEEHPYNLDFKNKFKIINAPFNPWSQSEEFKNNHAKSGTNIEIAYKFFSLECKSSINLIIKTILNNENAIVVHCHAGKDRTGIVITLLHLLINADRETVYKDYLASAMDTKKEYIDIFLDVIAKEGGVENYLKSCAISSKDIEKLLLKLKVSKC